MEGIGGSLGMIQGKVETFTCTDKAPSVLLADAKAWSYLEAVLGGDPLGAWTLKAMQHSFGIDAGTPYVKFLAEFLRNQDYEVEAEA